MGNGSAELIFLVARALTPRRALIVAPAFSEYEDALEAVPGPLGNFTSPPRRTTSPWPSSPDPQGAGLVFLANPASPSGACSRRNCCSRGWQNGTRPASIVALDEAFIDFVEEASAKVFLPRFPRLIILRSFTKFFAIPGLRLGYLLAAPDLIESVWRWRRNPGR